MQALAIIAIIILAVAGFYMFGNPMNQMYPAKLGWMDDKDFTEADRLRVAEISGQTSRSNEGVIGRLQSGLSGGITRKDFELMRQDRRRAQAAYPDVKSDDLFTDGWVQVDMSARIPDSFCTSGNSNGTQGPDGKWYLDGGCYSSFVRSQYTKRADAATTKNVLAERKSAEQQKEMARIAKWGYSTSWGGTGGSASVNGNPDPLPSNVEADERNAAGQVVVIIDGKTRYQFPFLATDWIDPPYSKEGLAHLAESRGAVATDYTPPRSKPWVMKDGFLARGEKCPDGRLCWSKWNGDGYDNDDIGPSDPESWVLEQPFGIAYLPAPDNGEGRSDPSKPWYIVVTYYGSPPQISGGWTQEEAKKALPKFQTEQSFGMMGQDNEELNRGNLKEARATQRPPTGGIKLADRAFPARPPKPADTSHVPYSDGMTLGPGQSTTISASVP